MLVGSASAILAAGAIAIGLNSAPVAYSAVDCTAGLGVTQTATTVTGTGGNDTIDCTGASPAKTVNGNAGNDTITGTAFADTLNGGTGNDDLNGGPGSDRCNQNAGHGARVACES